MSKRSWIRNVFARPVTRPMRKAPPRARLLLEALEDRTAPAIVGPYLPTSTHNQPAPALPDSLRGDPSITTISWGGRDTFAKAGQWIVRFEGVTGTQNEQLGALQARLAGATVHFEVSQHLGMSGAALIQGPADLGFEKVHTALASLPGFRYVEPNLVEVNPLNLYPDDPSFGQLYGMDNTGQPIPGLGNGTPDADIDAPEAWNLTTGSSSIVVADIDTGVDYTHPDLAANMWHNPGEIADNGIDDDGNGFVDDFYGYDFINNDSDPMDDFGHGTHTAGTIGAVGNNAIGVAGVNWNVQLMAVKWIAGDGSGTEAAAIAATNYVTMMRTRGVNVRVTSNSWHLFGPSQGLKDALTAAGDAGMLTVFAAGNDGNNRDFVPDFPSSYRPDLPDMITVAATDNRDNKAD